jgi:predicted amidophosphoribosyltransferase
MLISELEFGSFLAYCPDKNTQSEKIKESKNIMLFLKKDQIIEDHPMSEIIAERVKNNLSTLPFKEFFGKDVALIPVPKSSLMKTDSLWVSDRLASALANKGLGIHFPCLERIRPVPKSAYSKSENRPKATDHFNSIRCITQLQHPSEMLLIDDVITRGATMLGCASVLKQRFPNTVIRGFAAIRTISNPSGFTSLQTPCIGKITLKAQDTIRRP